MVGSSSSLYYAQLLPSGILPSGGQRGHRFPKSVDAFAVDWLDSNVAISGWRNGNVVLWDTRINSTGTTIADQALRFEHKRGVCILNMKAWNDNQVTVAGTRNTLCTHYKRMSKKRDDNGKPYTIPYLECPTYRNTAQGLPLGFDVSSRLNAIAAASDRAEVHLFDASNGKEVHPRGIKRLVYSLFFTILSINVSISRRLSMISCPFLCYSRCQSCPFSFLNCDYQGG